MLLDALISLPDEQAVPTLFPAVIPTTLVRISPSQATALANYLEAHQLAEPLAEKLILDAALLTLPDVSDCWLDLSLLTQAEPSLLAWFQERQCSLQAGCRVIVRNGVDLSGLLNAYNGSLWEWKNQGYALVPFPAQEFSIALSIIDCPHLFQQELPLAGYLKAPVMDWSHPRPLLVNVPQKKKKTRTK